MNNINTKEHIIWSEIRQGNIASLGALYDLYIDSLISYGIKICGDKSYTMDCIHDLFVDLYKYKNKLGETDNIQFYLCTALKRKINRRYKSKEICFESKEFSTAILSKKNYETSFEDELVEKECQQEKVLKLNSSLKELTKKQRKGLKLRFQEDRSYEEIADTLNITVSSARTNVYRALKMLRKSNFTIIYIFILLFYK